MSTKDKTEDQLLSSIRKNKPAAPATPRKTVAKKKAAPRKAAAKPAAKPTAAATESAPAVSFHSGRRVWPD